MSRLRISGLPVAIRPSTMISVYYAAIWLALTIDGVHIFRTFAPWTIADWMINYRGGFVRRGLMGEIVLRSAYLLHVAPHKVVLGLAVIAYGIVSFGAARLLLRARWNMWLLLIALSPVTVAFPFVSAVGYHKDVLLIAGFVLLEWLIVRGLSPVQVSVFLSAFCVAGILSHEPFVVFAPYIVALVFVLNDDWQRLLKVFAAPALLGIVALAAVVTHPGDASTAQRVCASLGPQNTSLCSEAGSIQYLTYSKAEARADVVETIAKYHVKAILPPIALFAFLPYAGLFLHLRRRGLAPGKQAAIVGGLLTSAVLSSVLFIYATDWGRWLAIHFSLLFLLLLAAELQTPEGTPSEQIDVELSGRAVLTTLLLLVYTCCWSLPGYGNIPKAGYISMAMRMHARSAKSRMF